MFLINTHHLYLLSVYMHNFNVWARIRWHLISPQNMEIIEEKKYQVTFFVIFPPSSPPPLKKNLFSWGEQKL